MALVVFTIFCLFFVIAVLGWWSLLLIPLYSIAAIIKDYQDRKKWEKKNRL